MHSSPWPHILRKASLSGASASLLSIAALAACGRREADSALQPLNAPSHWVWGERALRADGASLRHTLLGLLTHHASALLWAVLYERLLARGPANGARRLGSAALVTATAAVVDLELVPKRLTPGFERHLSGRSLALVYAVFGIGLVAGSALAARSR